MNSTPDRPRLSSRPDLNPFAGLLHAAYDRYRVELLLPCSVSRGGSVPHTTAFRVEQLVRHQRDPVLRIVAVDGRQVVVRGERNLTQHRASRSEQHVHRGRAGVPRPRRVAKRALT